MANRTAAELTAWNHEYSRSWKESRDGEVLNYLLDLIPDEEYEVNEQALDEIEPAFRKVFGGPPP